MLGKPWNLESEYQGWHFMSLPACALGVRPLSSLSLFLNLDFIHHYIFRGGKALSHMCYHILSCFFKGFQN